MTKIIYRSTLSSSTFESMDLTASQIEDSHIIDTEELQTPAEHLKVPIMYLLPQLHKNLVSSQRPVSVKFLSF